MDPKITGVAVRQRNTQLLPTMQFPVELAVYLVVMGHRTGQYQLISTLTSIGISVKKKKHRLLLNVLT